MVGGSKSAKGGPYPLADLDRGVQIRCDAGRAVKPLFRNIVYDDFTENSQAVAAPPHDIFPEKSSTIQFRQNGPLYPASFIESGQVKALTDC